MNYYKAVATDYDGTAATEGRLSAAAAKALERVRASGGRTILVTGRMLPDLKRVCRRLELFDIVVAETF